MQPGFPADGTPGAHCACTTPPTTTSANRRRVCSIIDFFHQNSAIRFLSHLAGVLPKRWSPSAVRLFAPVRQRRRGFRWMRRIRQRPLRPRHSLVVSSTSVARTDRTDRVLRREVNQRSLVVCDEFSLLNPNGEAAVMIGHSAVLTSFRASLHYPVNSIAIVSRCCRADIVSRVGNGDRGALIFEGKNDLAFLSSVVVTD